MKKIILIILLCILLLEGVALAALSFDETYYMQHLSYVGSGSSVTDPLYLFMNESIGYLEGSTGFGSVYFNPTDTAPTASEGMVYYNESDESLKLRTSSAWVDIDVSGASSLGSAYAIGSAITVDTDAITLTSTDAANNVILALVHGETGNFSALTITNASAYPAIQITGSSTGADITGTSATWSVATTGVATLVGADIGNGDLEFTEASNYNISLIGDVDGVLTISASGKEDIEFNLVTADTLTITTSTSVDKVNWGDVDEHSGILSITMEGSELATVTNIGTGAGDDLVISQATSGQNASLLLASSGTSVTDALIITTSVGTIDLNSADNLDIDVDDEITINTANGGYALTIAGSSLGDYTLTVADDFSTIVVGSLLIQNTEAASDITINSVAGTIIIEAEEDAANAIYIVADGSTASTIKIFNDTGNADESIFLASDLGGITLNAAAGSIDVEAVGGDTGDLLLSAGDVLTLTSVDTKIFDGASAETWIIEGSVDEHEASIVFTDPTADVIYTFPVMAADTVALMLSTLATNAPDLANSVTGGTNQLIFEGSSVDTEETIIQATDPTADIIWILPDGAADSLAFIGSTLVTNYPDIANSVTGGTNQLIFEGSSADAYETILTVTNPTSADKTITFPNKTGQVMLSSAASALSASTTPTLTVGLSNLYSMTPTDDENQTITFSGAGTSGDVITIVFTANTTNDEVITFHATLVSSTGTLTIGTTASRYYSITFISNGSHWYEVARTGEQT